MSIRCTTFILPVFLVLLSTSIAFAGGGITWESAGGPAGGFVNALVLAPNTSGLLFAGTNGGVYVSTNDGARWQSVSKGLPDDPTITALAVAPDAKTIFAGTHTGIYRTLDGGANWAASNTRLDDQFILSLVIDSQLPNLIYAGTPATVLKSDNNGDTWSDAAKDMRFGRVSALALSADPPAIFAATDAGIFVSRDRGTKWQPVSDGLPDNARAQAIAVAGHTWLAGTTQGLFRTPDGKAWSAVSGSLSGVLIRPIVSDPRQPNRVFAVTERGIAKSTDSGATWTPLVNALTDTPILSLALGDKNALYAGTVRGAFKTVDDGINWQPINTGLVSTNVNTLLLASENPTTLFAATPYGLAFTSDRGTNWNYARGLSTSFVLALAADPANPKTIYAGTRESSIFISTDGGASFSLAVEDLSNKSPILSLAVAHPTPNTTLVFAGTLGNSLFKSLDGGKKWVPQSQAGLGNVTRVPMLAFVPPSTVFAGTDQGLRRLDSSIVNATWQTVSPDLPVDEALALAFDRSHPQTLWAAFATNGIYRSDNGGVKWTRVGQGVLPTRVRFQALALNLTNADVIYLGTDRGVYRSDDGGKSWIASNDGLPPNANVQSIAIDPQAPSDLFAGTNGNGVVHGVDQIQVTLPAWLPVGALGLGVLGLLAISGILIWRIQFSPAAQERAWARDWPVWDVAITNALWAQGIANESILQKLPRRRLARALQRYAQQHADDGLTLQAVPVALKLENFPVYQKFLSHWKAAWEVVDSEDAFKSVTSEIVDELCTYLGFTRVDERAYRGSIGYVVKAPSLRLKVPPRFPLIFIPRREINETDISAMRDLMGVLNMTSYFALIIDLRDTPTANTRQSLKRLVRQAIHDFIVLDGSDIRSLLVARDHTKRLVEIILDQVDLTVVSPYVTSGPVPENMFFGREYELKTIVRTVRDTNYAIVGGRKIGKTSVLTRVYRLLQETPEYLPFYLDCQAIHSHADFFAAIETIWRTHLPSPTVEGLRSAATDLSTQYPSQRVVLLFDEIDELLQHDIAQGEHLFQTFRALSQERLARFVFCGEKMLNASLHDARLVFFNFCNVISLTYLAPEEARRVVIEPMQEMGITLEDDGALADQIVDLTSGHPNIVQYLCQKLIERINIRRDRIITRADLRALSQSAQFAEYFTEITWGSANTLERLITIIMLRHPEVTLSEMADMLRAYNLQILPTKLENAFDDLCLFSILRQDGPKYTFAARAFTQVLRHSKDVNGLLASLIQELQNDGANQ